MKRIMYVLGDGTGPELTKHALRVLESIGKYDFVEAKAGYSCYQEYGDSIPQQTIDLAKDNPTRVLQMAQDWTRWFNAMHENKKDHS